MTMTTDNLKAGKFNCGKSDSAFLRRLARAERNSEILAGKPGDVIEMSRGRKYEVDKDGAFRRQLAA
jgi:hypothetical protein